MIAVMAPADPDYRTLFESVPGLYLVLLPDAPKFTIVTASDEYLHATMTERAAIAGKGLFEVFPDNPEDAQATGTRNLRASLDRVLLHRKPDAMAVQKYDVRRPATEGGAFEERYWSPLNAPLCDEQGRITHIIHRVEDVTEFVRMARRHDRENAELKERGERIESEIFLRGRQLQEANEQLRQANERLALLGEQHLRTLFDTMPQLGWTALPDGFVDFYNRGWYVYTGTTYEQMQGWGWQAVQDPVMLPKVMERWRTSLTTGTPFEMELSLRRHDGVFRWFLTRGTPIRDADGKIVRWVGVNTDIHDSKQAVAASEHRLKLLIDSIREYAVFMLDPNGHIATWSPGAERIKQYRAEEIIGRHFSAFYPDEDIRSGKPQMELRVASSEGRFEDEGWRVRKDGSRFWASVVISAVRDANGALVGFSKVTRDLTDRKRAEEERVRLAVAEASQERLQFLAEASAVLFSSLDYEATLDSLGKLLVPKHADWCSVQLLDERGQVQLVTVRHVDPEKMDLARELQRRWPVDPKSDVGVPKVLRTGQAELYEAVTDDVLAAASVDEEQLRIARELRLRSGLLVPIVGRHETIGVLGLVAAESNRRYRPDDVALFEELGRRAGTAIENARLYRQTENAVRLRDDFLSIASHELKTPLTSMQLQVSGIRRSVSRPDSLNIEKLARRVDVIDQQLDRLTALIGGLLDVSRTTAGRLQLEIGDVDLRSTVHDAIARLRTELENAGCAISVDVDEGIVGRWDKMRLDQVITNFVTNAIKYGAGKPIDVRGRRSQRGTAILTVADRGIGIASDDQSRIFDRFERAVSVQNYGGLGLGLWIIKEFVSAMGGAVSVESRPGEGATFTAELPLRRVEDRPSLH